MTVVVSESAKALNVVVLFKCEHFGQISLYAGRVKILEWFNKHTGRNIKIRQFDRYIHELVSGGLWKRWPRKKDMAELGKIFTSAGTSITKNGLKALEWAHYRAFEIYAKIRANRPPRKKRVPSTEVKGTREGSTAPIGEVIKKIIKLPETS